jgi:hypothetical protein
MASDGGPISLLDGNFSIQPDATNERAVIASNTNTTIFILLFRRRKYTVQILQVILQQLLLHVLNRHRHRR